MSDVPLQKQHKSTSAKDDDDDGPQKMFLTTSDVLNSMNTVLEKMESPGETMSPRFELQRRLPDGSTRRADEKDVAAADMESKFKQAAEEIKDLNPKQKIEWADLQRRGANNLYRDGQYKEALDAYLTCLVAKTDNPEFLDQVFVPVMNNLAQCALQLGNYKKAETFCTMALEEKELPLDHRLLPKLYFRRGKSRRLRGLYNGAKQDLTKVLELLKERADLDETATTSDDDNEQKRATSKELSLVERAQQEAKQNKKRQKQAMRQVFETKPALGPQHSSKAKNTLQEETDGAPALYQDVGVTQTKREYSTLRARRKVPLSPNEDDEESIDSEVRSKLTCWQYYLAVVGRIAEGLLVLLGDEEFVREQQARRRRT